MRRFWGLVALVSAALAAGMGLTALLPIGAPLWHYNAAFLLILAGTAAAWPLVKRRRVTSIGMAYTGILATASGFVMLYTKELPLKEWVTWWHSVTSFAFTLLFLVHWFLNSPRLLDLTRRVMRAMSTGAPVVGVWIVIALAFAWTWASAGRALFRSENYIHLSTWAVFVGTGLTYGIWLAFRHPRLQARLGRPAVRTRARGLVDTSLFLACWASLLTGFALLYFADFLRGGDLKYVSKWWHTATSVALLGLVAIHVGFNARILGAHARRVDRELRSAEDHAPLAPVDPTEP